MREIVFAAHYLVMGLGDVYLGAPVATPLDPRHRLVTTKYNPARTWTAENSVGIGGSYLCIYGMEGPGGYQFVGRTLQMWNRYREPAASAASPGCCASSTRSASIPVEAARTRSASAASSRWAATRSASRTPAAPADYQDFLRERGEFNRGFASAGAGGFDAERERWIATGQSHFERPGGRRRRGRRRMALADGQHAMESHIAGNLWQVASCPGKRCAPARRWRYSNR